MTKTSIKKSKRYYDNRKAQGYQNHTVWLDTKTVEPILQQLRKEFDWSVNEAIVNAILFLHKLKDTDAMIQAEIDEHEQAIANLKAKLKA